MPMRLSSTMCLGLGLAAFIATAACSSGRYVYRPEENATARMAGRPAALYRIPPRAPHGDVRVATLGIATLAPREHDEARMHAMHVRLIVSNNDDSGPWQVDTREQIGSLDSYGQSRPAFASAGVGHPPIVAIAPG